ncbi:hypothetical protein [Streptomyces sp. NPDC048496]|uniref:hypothetical protein n=1 Tax=Streptomyces sp. NPDC048496 TaxID=3365558 RepID=UPI00371399E3
MRTGPTGPRRSRGIDTRRIGFDDAYRYEDFKMPLDQRRIRIEQVRPESALTGSGRPLEVMVRQPGGFGAAASIT